MKTWVKAAKAEDIPLETKGCVKFGDTFIAVIHYDENTWYAVQNVCPHMKENVLSRGIIGDKKGEPKLVCPLHKNAFSLQTGAHLGGNEHWTLTTYPIKQEGNFIYIELEQEI